MRSTTKTSLVLFISILLSSDSAFANEPILPITSITPGATNPAVTQSNIKSTICVIGYTATIRPSSSYTNNLKRKQLSSTYSFYHNSKLGDFEEDHLISLELGGSPTNPKNLWPEPYNSSSGARVKDQVENKLHLLVCSGKLTLVQAQNEIAGNWWDAYQKYILGKISTPSTQLTPAPSASQSTEQNQISTSPPAIPTPTNNSNKPQSIVWPDGATAKCADGTFSDAISRRGVCSHHGGVLVFKSS
jgi:hypothetical protein